MDRAGISADRACHTCLHGVNLRESARAAGDMFGGGSSVFFEGVITNNVIYAFYFFLLFSLYQMYFFALQQ